MNAGLFRLLALAALAAAGGVHAWTPSTADERRLAAGAIVMEVTGDVRAGTGRIRGAVDIAAPPAVVWRLMTDCAAARRMAPIVRGCRILEADPQGRWDVREMILHYGFLMGRVQSRFRADFEPERRIAFTCIPTDDVRACRGEWRLQPLDGGARTRVTYENTLTANVRAPAPLVRAALRSDAPSSLRVLRREALREVAARP